MKSIKLNKRELYLMFITLTSILFIYFKFWYFKKNQEFNKIKIDINFLQDSIKNKKNLLETLKSRMIASETLTTTNKDYYHVDKQFSNFLQKIGISAEESEIQINRIALENQDKIDGWISNALSIDLQTSFMKVGQLLDYLENLDFLNEVHSVEISRISNDLKLCSAHITLNSYVMEITP